MARVAFVQNVPLEYPGVSVLSAVLRERGHETALFTGTSPARLAARIAAWAPGIAGLPVMTGNQRWACEVAREIKRRLPSTTTVLGGAHPTIRPEIVEQEGVDVVCRGEGERALTDLTERVDRGGPLAGIANLWVKTPGGVERCEMGPLVGDLGSLPLPDHAIYRARSRHIQPWIHTVRGCPFSCTYCHNHQFREIGRGLGTYVRTRPVDDVLAEIRALGGGRTLRSIHFCDDIFGVDIVWLRAFSARYRAQIGLPYQCMQASHLMDEERVQLLARSGCAWCGIGLDSGSPRVRRELLDRPGDIDALVLGARALQDAGIKLRVNVILGFPGETPEEMLETLEVCRRIRPWQVLCHVFVPYPGTALASRAERMGLLEPGYEERIPPTFNRASPLRSPHRREVENLHALAQLLTRVPQWRRVARCAALLPHNPVFSGFYLACLGWQQMSSGERDAIGSLHQALSNLAFWYR